MRADLKEAYRSLAYSHTPYHRLWDGGSGRSAYGVLCELFRRRVRAGSWRKSSMFGAHFVLDGVIYRIIPPVRVLEWAETVYDKRVAQSKSMALP